MAATAPLEIQVYASFPSAVAVGADHNVQPTNWRPYKWIRYAIGVVAGAEGDLSSTPDSPKVVDYNAGLPTESTVLYYHASDEEKQKMFPVDPNIGRSNITSSVATTRRAQFRNDVADRDGEKCILTSMDQDYCDAVHVLAHRKGDTYISTYTQRRGRDPAGGDIVQDINGVRNGLFLNNFTHTALGKHVAFLMAPNFAMTAADVDPTMPPTERRCTAHAFKLGDPFLLGSPGIPSGSPLRISDTPTWPPAILFDAVYAGAVLHHFGTQALVDEFTTSWKDSYYPSGAMTAAGADFKTATDKRVAVAGRSENQVRGRQARFNAPNGPDTFDMLLALSYILVPQNELQAALREAKEKAEEKEQRRVQEKVDTWKRQVTAAYI